ncbi:hypothetical protein GCM10007918_26040 [Piscinibacter gummiphilus]|nr:hypothetical protein GCM10007918_26040 [Piscinibacter gummiphilus]
MALAGNPRHFRSGRRMNRRVILHSFNGSTSAPSGCKPEDNYWLLVGQSGTALEPTNERSRVLVKFDVSVVGLGLHCHNPVENTLLILEGDLRDVEWKQHS